ncbi:hypothetical protein [Lactococcus garvieae]|uniref:Uncharacterized protein n=1 Tax=Lactococcus garvieae DCC43 TaxID=1231377 RepID=K2PJM2_9LACT|nr:hypothetical protein [Lactococcus garvieae]EKF50424.1 hypothetical protein C426_2204 [Lactococcus garvieae DCC43]
MKRPIYEEIKTYGGDIIGKNIIGYEMVSRPGFSKIRHKKHLKRKVNKNLTLDDFRKAGKGYANIIKAFAEGMAEVINEKVY